MKRILTAVFMVLCSLSEAHAGPPMYTIEPLSNVTVGIPSNSSNSIQYLVTNQSSKAITVVMQPITGINQAISCELKAKNMAGSSCTITLNINGSDLPENGIQGGPRLCRANPDGSPNPNQCYQATANNALHVGKLPTLSVGQATQGGIVACLDGGLQNLIAAPMDNSTGIQWGGQGTDTSSQGKTDGAANTTSIVNTLGAGTYAAKLCYDYEIDSEGKTPCSAGNTCYSDWFLPAENQLDCLYTNKATINNFANAAYWTSSEWATFPDQQAWYRVFANGFKSVSVKGASYRVRCVRAFTPS